MGLRARLESRLETVQDFELAAEQRYWEGLELLIAGRLGAGSYLLGYTAEMLLKNACFRVDGARPADAIGPLLGPSRTWMRVHYPTVGHEGYHSLWFWLLLLRGKRRRQGRRFDPPMDWRLVRCVRRLYQNWWAPMRYRPDQISAAEARAVYDDVTWLRDRYPTLWR